MYEDGVVISNSGRIGANGNNGLSGKRFYGRRGGRRLSPRRIKILKRLLPTLLFEYPNGLSDHGLLAQFNDCLRVHLEIGFGAGEHLLARAQDNPTVGFIGCELFVDGFAKITEAISNRRLTNIRLVKDEASRFISMLPDDAISKVYLLYPDPWPKRRHRNRRFVSGENIAELARILTPGGVVQLASDIDNYVAWGLRAFNSNQRFRWVNNNPELWCQPFDHWPGTRYERKATSAGRTPTYLTFVKVR